MHIHILSYSHAHTATHLFHCSPLAVLPDLLHLLLQLLALAGGLGQLGGEQGVLRGPVSLRLGEGRLEEGDIVSESVAGWTRRREGGREGGGGREGEERGEVEGRRRGGERREEEGERRERMRRKKRGRDGGGRYMYTEGQEIQDIGHDKATPQNLQLCALSE